MAFSARLKPSAEPEQKCSKYQVCFLVISVATGLTNGYGGTRLALLSCQVINPATGIVTRHRTQQDRSACLDLQER